MLEVGNGATEITCKVFSSGCLLLPSDPLRYPQQWCYQLFAFPAMMQLVPPEHRGASCLVPWCFASWMWSCVQVWESYTAAAGADADGAGSQAAAEPESVSVTVTDVSEAGLFHVQVSAVALHLTSTVMQLSSRYVEACDLLV